MMTTKEIIRKIKLKNWEICVNRQGYLQSKLIALYAENISIKITPKIIIKISDVLWVKNTNVYLVQRMKSAFSDFEIAFNKRKNWPIEVYKKFKQDEKDIILFIDKIKNSKQINKINIFKEYVDSLLKIQKYYVIAEPLANYCENKIRSQKSDLLKFAFSYDPLEIENIKASLRKIKRCEKKDELIKNHLKKFGWILTSYNIIKTYNKKDVLCELKEINGKVIGHSIPIKAQQNNLLRGLQIGIFMRNRIKELSQQLWFYINPIAIEISKDLIISRDDFFQLTPDEAIESMKKAECQVMKSEIKKRKNGFICGILNNKEILISGKISDSLYTYFNKIDNKKIHQIKGVTACRGIVKGIINIIMSYHDFNKFNEGDILVTSMTTPDYIILMKKACAFITDEGGLSCHAAIVAREMNKPCIIGTKIATKVLKDGDLVEVDANKGVVKILKKAKN